MLTGSTMASGPRGSISTAPSTSSGMPFWGFKMSDLKTSEPVTARIMRFAPADFQQLGEWMVWRLKDRFPQVHDGMIAGWLKSQMDSNEAMFLRFNRAIGLAAIGHKNVLDPKPIIEEVFVLIHGRETDGKLEDAALKEGQAIY